MDSLTHIPDAMQAAILNLRQSFVDELADRIVMIEIAAKRLSADTTDAVARDTLQRDCHKMSGIAGTLGFSEMGDVAAAIDRHLLRGAAWSVVQPLVETLMDHMEAALD